MKIKKATLSDIPRLAPVFHEYRESSVSYKGDSCIEDSGQWLFDRISSNEAVIFVMAKETDIIGFATLYQGFSSISLQKYWIFNDLYIVPDCRGKGYAKLIISEIHKHADASHSKGVELETAHSNLFAQSLYESLGYEEDKIYKRYFWKGTNFEYR